MKSALQPFLVKFAQQLPLNWLIQLAPQTPQVSVFYHTVCDYSLPHIRHLYPVKTVQAFEKDLDFLLRHFTVDINQATKNRPRFQISFDDGLRECHDIIAPVLLRKGIPATFFINSAFVDNQALFYRYQVSLLLERLEGNADLLKSTPPSFQMGQTKEKARQKLLSLKYSDQAFIQQLAQYWEVDFNAFLEQFQPYMSHDQLRSLLNQGFLIGGHSHDHPEYQELDLPEQLEQTRISLQYIIKKLGLKHPSFSFPFTDYQISKDFFFQLHKEFVGINTFGTAGLKKEEIKNHFQRIPMENGYLDAEQILKSEYLYYLLKQPFGKNTIRRT